MVSLQGGEAIVASRRTGLDITSEAQINQYFDSIGQFDHLILTAGSSAPSGDFTSLSVDGVKSAFDTKFWGTMRVIQKASEYIDKRGSITLTSGFLSRRVVAGTWAKTAINAAIEATAKLLAKELSPIRVNVVSPGLTQTEAYSSLSEQARETLFSDAAKRLPAQYVATAEDQATGYLLLLTNPAITGAVIDIDGGALVN